MSKDERIGQVARHLEGCNQAAVRRYLDAIAEWDEHDPILRHFFVSRPADSDRHIFRAFVRREWPELTCD